MGAASGITAAQPSVLELLRQTIGSSLVYGSTMKPSFTRISRRLERLLVVGEERLLVADDLELHQLGHAELARQAAGAHRLVGGVAAGGVGQERVAASASSSSSSDSLAAVA